MSAQADLVKLSVHDFAQRFRQEMIPLSNTLAYFSAMPLSEEELKDYLEEPSAALPPRMLTLFPRMLVALVPYLEKSGAKAREFVTFDQPEERSQASSAQFLSEGEAVLVFAIKERDIAEYHYVFYRAVASLAADRLEEDELLRFYGLLREELRNGVHGEVDEAGWNLKQLLLRRQSEVRRESKGFRAYARQALIDTLTLYLHGICCDIDVETGPRQLRSRQLRKRLELLHDMFPPPHGYAVFPEELSK